MKTFRPQRFLSVIVKLIGVGTLRGARVRLTSTRFGKSRSFPYDYSGDALYQAIKIFAENGVAPVASTAYGRYTDMLLFQFPTDGNFSDSPFAKFFRIS